MAGSFLNRALLAELHRLRDGAPRADVPPLAAILCPADWSIPLERLFGAAASDELYVVQGDISVVSPDLLASLEWAAVRLGIGLAVILGSLEIREELASRMAPYAMQVVNGVVGPNEVVRFEPPLRSGPLAQMCRSR